MKINQTNSPTSMIKKQLKRRTTAKLDFSDITEEQRAYFAGFLDGDGSIIAQFVKSSAYQFGYQIRLSVTFIQKVSRMHHLANLKQELGLGTVRDRGDGIADYCILGASIKPFLEALLPYLRIKKKQANLVLKIIEQLPSSKDNPELFLEVCNLVDQVSNLNDSRNRKNTYEVVAASIATLLSPPPSPIGE